MVLAITRLVILVVLTERNMVPVIMVSESGTNEKQTIAVGMAIISIIVRILIIIIV